MNGVQTFRQRQEISPAALAKLIRSKEETKNLSMRDIRCPFCGFLIDRVYSDISGHKEICCRKCKQKYIINLGYFRRQKVKTYFKLSFPNKGRQNR